MALQVLVLKDGVPDPWGTDGGTSSMAELFVMCPECGLNAKLAPGAPKIGDNEGQCLHGRDPMACPILGPILHAMLRVASPREQLAD